MNRRDMLKMIAAATGASLIAGDAMAYVEMPAATPLDKTHFSRNDFDLWSSVCDTIIPRTDTPGAVDAGTPAFTLRFIHDCYAADELSLFKAGLMDIEKRSQASYGKQLTDISAEQRFDLLSSIDKEAVVYNQGNPEGEGAWSKVARKHLPHYFTIMKQITLFGFFTSELGATQALRYVSVPGHYDGNFDYKKGDKAWAPEY